MILVTGATGFLGKHVCIQLDKLNLKYYKTSLTMGTDLRDRQATFELFKKINPDYVINCAAFVGGIQFGYKFPAELFHYNYLMTINLFEACKEFKVKRLINPISNCAYPAKATLFKEEEFWDGPLHESVLVYGFSRKGTCVASWAYQKQYGLDSINLILSNMYGPGDHFEEERSHALGALIMKFVNAKKNNLPFVNIWGTGNPVREWMFVEDGAKALILALDIPAYIDPINVGIAKGISVKNLAELIKNQVGYNGDLKFDLSKPDGAAFKTVDGSRGKEILKWAPSIELEAGISLTIDWYLKNVK